MPGLPKGMLKIYIMWNPLTGSQPDKLRFFASIIIKLVAEMFYGKKRYGTALYYATQEYFLPLPDTIIIIACTQIYHAISEYSSGQRKTTKFEGDEMECKWP
jgi:hypothetical protein